jgi:hypothetical protein
MHDSKPISNPKEVGAVLEEPENDGKVRLSPEMHRRLKIESASIGMSMKDCVEEAIDLWLSRSQSKRGKAGAA